MKLTIKEQFMQALERIAATVQSRKVTVILLCEGATEHPALYVCKDENGFITVLSADTNKQTISNILNTAFNETQKASHRP